MSFNQQPRDNARRKDLQHIVFPTHHSVSEGSENRAVAIHFSLPMASFDLNSSPTPNLWTLLGQGHDESNDTADASAADSHDNRDLFVDNLNDTPPQTIEFLQNKIVGLYFSAHWCPPCRKFTPLLSQRYLDLQSQAEVPFEIIFVSSDQNEESALEYFSSMPWKMLRFSEREVKQQLAAALHISGIPSLVLFDEEGNLITEDGRSVVFLPPSQWKTYESGKAEAERALDEKMLSLPETITHEAHPHPLIKTKDPYGHMSYGCDVCSLVGGTRWSYHCPSCRWDAHPSCVCNEQVPSPSTSEAS
jgi:thiol-disulfide isomerase/thioredoxin